MKKLSKKEIKTAQLYENWKTACRNGDVEAIKKYELLPQYAQFLLARRSQDDNHWIINLATIDGCIEGNNPAVLQYFSSSELLKDKIFNQHRAIVEIFGKATSQNADKIIGFLFDNELLVFPNDINIHHILAVTIREEKDDLIKFIFNYPKNNISLEYNDYIVFKAICEKNSQELLCYFIHDKKLSLNKDITAWLKGDSYHEVNYYPLIEKIKLYGHLNAETKVSSTSTPRIKV